MTLQTSSFLSRAAGQVAYYILSFGINAVGRYFMLALLWRSLDFASQQSYAKLQVALSLVCVVADFGLENAIIRFYAKDKSVFGFTAKRLKRLSVLLLIPGAAIFGIWWKFQFGTWAGFAMSIFGIGYAFFQIAAAFSRAETRVRTYAVINLVRNGLSIAAIAGLFYGLGSLTLESWFSAQAVIALAMTVVLMIKTGKSVPRNDHIQSAPLFSHYSTAVVCANAILWLEALWDIVFINHFRPEQLPLYQLVLDYGSFLGMITMLVTKSWPAMYFTMVADKTSDNTIGKRLITMQWVTGIGLILLFLLAPAGMHLLSGRELPLLLYPVLALMLSTQAMVMMLSILRPMLEFRNDVKAIAIIFGCAAVLTLALNAILVSRFGIMGTAISGMISASGIFWAFSLRLRNHKTIPSKILPMIAGQQVLFGVLMVILAIIVKHGYQSLLPAVH
jgi:O-antigen/teichoic acid export membrane protein